MKTKPSRTKKSRPLTKHNVSGSATPKLERVVVIGKFSDNKCRQLLVERRTEQAVLQTIILVDNGIKVLDKIIEGIDIEIQS
jgi:hypothetical protein